jgi:hypothetical protein
MILACREDDVPLGEGRAITCTSGASTSRPAKARPAATA